MIGPCCDPRFWRRFKYGKTSKTSEFRELILYRFMNFSIPGNTTDRDLVQQLAKESHIPIESLSDELNLPRYYRSRAIFGFAGDKFDEVARNHRNMQWW